MNNQEMQSFINKLPVKGASFLTVYFSLLLQLGFSHPGSGIAVDITRKIIYFIPLAPAKEVLVVNPNGVITSLVRDDRLSGIHHLSIDSEGNIYTVPDRGGVVYKITSKGEISIYCAPERGDPEIGSYGDPFTIDDKGAIWFVSFCRIYITSPGSRPKLVAGNEKCGNIDGSGSDARFDDLHYGNFNWGFDGHLYLCSRNRVCRISAEGSVITLNHGVGTILVKDSAFYVACALGSDGTLYLADAGTNEITRMSQNGIKSHLKLDTGSLENPSGIAIGENGSIYIIDYSRVVRILKVSSDHKTKIIAEW